LQLRQQQQQRQQREQQRQQRLRQLRQQLRQPGQQLRQLGQQLQQPVLRQEQQLLLFGRKRSWKQPAERPGVRNISFDFPLLTNIKTHTRDRSGTLRSSRRADSSKTAKENHNLLIFFRCRKIALFYCNNPDGK
jgi:hypothetical protein